MAHTYLAKIAVVAPRRALFLTRCTWWAGWLGQVVSTQSIFGASGVTYIVSCWINCIEGYSKILAPCKFCTHLWMTKKEGIQIIKSGSSKGGPTGSKLTDLFIAIVKVLRKQFGDQAFGWRNIGWSRCASVLDLNFSFNFVRYNNLTC